MKDDTQKKERTKEEKAEEKVVAKVTITMSRFGRNGGNGGGSVDRETVLEEASTFRTAAGYESGGSLLHSLEERKMTNLPALASDFFSKENNEGQHHLIEKSGWEPIIRTVLTGTRDEINRPPISLLRSHEDTIVRYIFSFLKHPWARHVKLTVPAALVGSGYDWGRLQFPQGRTYPAWEHRDLREDLTRTSCGFDDGFVSYARVGMVTFPSPSGINVNMMPFKFGNKNSLPKDLHCYYDLIESCPYNESERGKVGYLTVHESYVDIGKAQRREGLHIESPGFFRDEENYDDDDDDDYDNDVVDENDDDNDENEENGDDEGNGDQKKNRKRSKQRSHTKFTPGEEHPWGMGVFFGQDRFEGGIYMASSVADTSQVWDALVDNRVGGIVDKHGGCEHLRPIIGPGTMLAAGELIWMTDCTPHEAVPQTSSGHRQFFRVVSPYISHWYEQHSTPNPNVPLPRHVKIIKNNKFDIRDETKEKKKTKTGKLGRMPRKMGPYDLDY